MNFIAHMAYSNFAILRSVLSSHVQNEVAQLNDETWNGDGTLDDMLNVNILEEGIWLYQIELPALILLFCDTWQEEIFSGGLCVGEMLANWWSTYTDRSTPWRQQAEVHSRPGTGAEPSPDSSGRLAENAAGKVSNGDGPEHMCRCWQCQGFTSKGNLEGTLLGSYNTVRCGSALEYNRVGGKEMRSQHLQIRKGHS